MTPEFKSLSEAVGRLRDIESAIKQARGIPSSAEYQANRCSVYAERDGYNPVPSEIVARVKAAAAACAVQLRIEGEAVRDEKLSAFALEIEAIRATLPALAAKAAISLGEFARDIHQEPAK